MDKLYEYNLKIHKLLLKAVKDLTEDEIKRLRLELLETVTNRL